MLYMGRSSVGKATRVCAGRLTTPRTCWQLLLKPVCSNLPQSVEAPQVILLYMNLTYCSKHITKVCKNLAIFGNFDMQCFREPFENGWQAVTPALVNVKLSTPETEACTLT